MSSTPSREELIFSAAAALEGTARQAYLDEACTGFPGLRSAIESLLRAHDSAGEFLAPVVAEPPIEEIPDLGLDRYKVVRKLGEGGCGVVYEAEQQEPVRRQVALKVIKPGMDSKAVIGRFDAERQALARMDHPGIAKVFDAGVTKGGRPYFVMELVRGRRITDYCDEQRLPVSDRLALFTHLCQALLHAHQKRIIHRDLKPSNVLVVVRHDTPTPVVIDFGIAKATEGNPAADNSFTDFGHFIGTPAYMSPEQAAHVVGGVDQRSDIYSLGTLLYELLSGRPPFDAQPLLNVGVEEIRRTIREVDPLAPSLRFDALSETDRAEIARQRNTTPTLLRSRLRGDLDAIVMKALEKERDRRYGSAEEFAADVARYLENLPVRARPQSGFYRLQKLLGRHKAMVGASVGIAIFLTLGAGFVVLKSAGEDNALHRAFEAEEANRRAEREAASAQKRAAEAEKLQAGLAQQAEIARRREAEQRQRAETSRANELALRAKMEEERAQPEVPQPEPASPRSPSPKNSAPASSAPDTSRTDTPPESIYAATRDTIYIVQISPKRLVAGVPTKITVRVKYSLHSATSARASLNFNTVEWNRYRQVASKLIDEPEGEIEFVVTTTPIEWPDEKPFLALIILYPDPALPGSRSLSSTQYDFAFR